MASVGLVAIDLPPASPDTWPAATRRVLDRLRAVWNAGQAALLLPPDPAAADRLVAELRPTARWPVADAEPCTPPPPGGPAPQGWPAPPGTALVVATSGSTGQPKGVVLSHAALAASTRASLARLGAQHGERFALTLPLEHVAGVQVVLRAWARGTEPVLPTSPGVLPDNAEHVSLVPTQLARLLADANATAALARYRQVLVGGARLDPALAARARDAGVPVVGSYGMSETGGGCVYDGRPLQDVEVALRADGRVRLRGPVLLTGYRTAHTPLVVPTDAEGWLTTGDAGRWCRDGRLEVLGRADDVIVSGGENVPAEAVAAALRALPGLADAAVTGRPDPEWGTVLTAVVVPANPSLPPALDDVREQLAPALPRRWLPRDLVVVDHLPRTTLGKIDGDRLRRLARRDGA